MSTSSELITARLTNAGEAADLIALVASRVYPSKPTQDAVRPFVTWWLVSGDGQKTLSGRSRLQPYELRVEATADTEAAAVAVIQAVRSALDGWSSRDEGIQGCFAQEDADQQTLDDGAEVAGQTFKLWAVL